MSEDIEKLYTRMIELETEVGNLREGYIIVNKRYSDSLASLKELTETPPRPPIAPQKPLLRLLPLHPWQPPPRCTRLKNRQSNLWQWRRLRLKQQQKLLQRPLNWPENPLISRIKKKRNKHQYFLVQILQQENFTLSRSIYFIPS